MFEAIKTFVTFNGAYRAWDRDLIDLENAEMIPLADIVSEYGRSSALVGGEYTTHDNMPPVFGPPVMGVP